MNYAKTAALAGAAMMLALASAGSASAQAMTMPSMSWPLAANPKPSAIDAGPFGNVYVTGAISGIGYTQDRAAGSDKKSRGDFSNAQVMVQTTEGPIQFFAQFGAYSFPTVGVPYGKAIDNTKNTFGVMPQAFVKFVPSENFSIMVGKLPTLIGAEYSFTFQNANITRGQLWNQENLINRGVQVNYASGPLSISASLNDGFYSGKYSWGSALVSYALNDKNVVAFAGGANFDKATDKSTSATPLLQNNSEIYNLIWTHTNGPLTIMPYVQYTRVPKMPALGVTEKASTTGVAVLGKYSFNENVSLAARAEHISTDGAGVTNLLYGPDSKATSLTLTPTFQKGAFFIRGEVAYIKLNNYAAGAGLGANGDKTSQTRALIETGILF
uniref:outer membrane beta-barrel protein n=1 Tax=uncultured Caulobacter sp. TaxID=158749 RepID=UPI0025CBDDAD|nr:outer membrane beta-barrel protein [uncultured Caulobacter sp.]